MIETPKRRKASQAWGLAAATIIAAVVLHGQTITITEFPIPTAASLPAGITAGPDGNLWFTEFSANAIGRITPAGVITEFPLPSAREPQAITAGPDGNLWFAEKGAIGQMTTAGVLLNEFLVGGSPQDITVGPDGALWFTSTGFVDRIGRITTAGVVTHFVVAPTATKFVNGITAGPDGNLWFTELAANQVGRITPAGVITEFALPTAGGQPFGITAGPDGNIWFTNGFEMLSISPAAPDTITEFFVQFGATIREVTTGPDGNIWFARGGSIGQITPGGVITHFPIPSGNAAYGITSGPDGNVWFTENTSSGNNIGRVLLSASPPPQDPPPTPDLGPNCVGKTVSSLAHEYGGIHNAALAQGLTVKELMQSIHRACGR